MNLIVDEFRNLLAIVAMELLLAIPCVKKRKNYIPRLVGGILVCLALVSLYVPFHDLILATQSTLFMTLFSVFWYIFVLALTGALLVFCHKINLTEMVWIMILSYAAQHLVYVITIEFLFLGIADNTADTLIQLGAYAVVAAVVYCVVYFLFAPYTKGRGRLEVQHNWKNCLVLSVFLFFFLLSTFINQANAWQNSGGINYLGVFSDLINCILVIVVQYVGLRNARMRNEKDMLKILLDNEKKQYEAYKNAVEYINIKSHDLKHEIAAMQREGKLNTELLEEITENIAVYEAFANTGNEILDALITDKNFICKNNGISFSCIVDASGFSSVKERDLFCLFGNILDNAIEYIKNVENPECRFIRLFARSQGNIKIIHQENYFDGALSFSDGLPQTTKKDKINHGFGTKSMKKIVEKYGGEIKFTVEDNLFKVDIVLVK